MNRNAEWKSFIDDIRRDLPPKLDGSAQRAVWRAKKRAWGALCIKIPAAGVFMSFVVFATLVNTSSRFDNKMKSIPLLRLLARALTANPSLRASFTANGRD